ncbi:hypothetical protein FOCC_FOCC015239 [Frankliniella occidentalis]|nr:hypothetical protein FOCC_FOCC015239 [Frankliniella occidentalis]
MQFTVPQLLKYSLTNQELTDGDKQPPKIVKMGATRWLSFYGAVKAHSEQYDQLHELFKRAATAQGADRDKCHMAHTLRDLHADGSHLLYLVFLRPILREVVAMNVAFQRSSGDIFRLYSDLKTFVFTMASKVVKPEAIR